jgi:hypothetical protein
MWKGKLSANSFGITHGVRQGGLLSPALFAVHLDSLIAELKLSGYGCRIGSQYFGVIVYADDIVLLSPTIHGLNRLLAVCSAWGKRNRLSFNPTKSQVICFGASANRWPQNRPIHAVLDGSLIPTCDRVIHLGHILSNDLSESAELERIGAAFNRQFHMFYGRFTAIRDKAILLRLYNSYCTSFYGLESVPVDKVSATSVRFLRKSVNLAIMRLLALPRESVSPYLIAYGVLNADATWTSRALSFWAGLWKSGDPISRFLVSFNCDTIAGHCSLLRILPAALPALTRMQVHQLVIDDWIRRKKVL